MRTYTDLIRLGWSLGWSEASPDKETYCSMVFSCFGSYVSVWDNVTYCIYSKICVKRPLKYRQNKYLNDQLSLNAGQKYCRMLQREHSAMLLTCIKRYLVLINNFQSFGEWPFYTGFTVCKVMLVTCMHIYPVAYRSNCWSELSSTSIL